ncbi:putative disease resistance protein RGA3 [Cocos nucifera]|uniref:Putative disease resistance protein RGA3 n=1 Tax=Cocos nucifera TaxID=13894 RepID=A0A8K0N820_COCNU|nr:putative disease resistance protein RGA3 [Cocos nucifera]
MAMIADAFVSKLCQILLTSAIEEASKILRVPDEIKKLHRRLKRIQVGLVDAENRRFDNDAINLWLNELRDLMYDADDIIDECSIEGQKLLSSSSSSSHLVKSVCYCLPLIDCLRKVRFHCEIGKRIRDLNRRLDELAKDKDALNLTPAPRNDHYESTRISRKTSPGVEPGLSAIVGMGGIGKTTLAQKIYNDEKLRDNFNQMPRIWLCVSQDFSESELLRSIIEQAGGNPREAKEKEVLEPMLSQLIANKKFFLVLDDVWDAQEWDKVIEKALAKWFGR